MTNRLGRARVHGRPVRSAFLTSRSRPAAAAMAALRRLPPSGRQRLANALIRVGDPLMRLPLGWRVGTSASALGLAATGRGPEASALLDGVAQRRRSRPGVLAGTALAIGEAALAERLAAVPPEPTAAVETNAGAALVAAEAKLVAGLFSDASRLADAYLARRPGDGYARLLADRIHGELRVRDTWWRPTIRRTTRFVQPVAGRVLHLLTNSLPDRQAGYTIRSHEVARCQVAAGLDPHLATRAGFPLWEGRARAPADERIDGIRYYRLAPDTPIDTPADRVIEATADAAAALVERLRPALLQPTSNHPNGQAALALRERFGIPVVYEVRGFLEESWLSKVGDPAAESERYRRTRDVETAVIRQADAIVTLSETMCTEIAGRGVPSERIVVIPNAVDVDRFTPREPDEDLRARLGLYPGVPVVGYISSLTEFEGVGYLLQAVALLRRRNRAVQALIVGAGPSLDGLRVQAGRLGLLDDTAILTGQVPRDQIEAYHALIDVFVVPRTADRVSQLVTPLKPYEAMAMERAVMVSDVAALREIVSHGESGIVFRAEDPLDLADRLEPLLDDPDLRRRLGQAARTWVAENRTWARNGERYRELFVRLRAA